MSSVRAFSGPQSADEDRLINGGSYGSERGQSVDIDQQLVQ